MADPVITEPDFLNMSDEDIMNFDPSKLVATENKEEEVKDESKEEDSSDEADDAADDADDRADEEDEGKSAEDESKADEEDKSESKVDETKEADKKDEQKEVAAVVDYEAEYKRILAPFKANGREIAVKSVDDAIALMQMGANYNKKMAALKPNLKLMKLLENNELLSEEKLSFLIDVAKKDPAAISKLVKDSGIDPMDLDADKAGTYKQTTYTVDDREIDLDTALEEIQDSPSYTRTLDVVSNKWDRASKKAIADTPELLKVINGHIESGIYDIISTELESERLFGRLKGLSDIEAYHKVGDAINARGGFNHLFNKQVPVEPKKVVVPPKAKADDSKLNDKRRAASSTKPASASKTDTKDFNPLALSDEEFSKIVNQKLL